MCTATSPSSGRSAFRLGHARGFSLVEVLVVITLVMVLLVLLMPVLLLGRVASQANQSLANCRQLTQLLHTYAYDN